MYAGVIQHGCKWKRSWVCCSSQGPVDGVVCTGEIVVEGPAFSVDSEARTADLSLGKMGDRASNPIRVVNVVLFQEWG